MTSLQSAPTGEIVVAGTGTGIGKTVFAAALAGALQRAYWKPIQAGLDGETDSGVVARLSGLPPSKILPERYRLRTPASPHYAAELDGIGIDLAALTPPATPCVIETAGGLMVPLTRTDLQIDLLARWQLPVVLVAATALGTINHTLLSIEALRRRDIPLLGVAFVGSANDDSERTICAFSGARRLGRLPLLANLDAASLRVAFAGNFSREDFP